MKQTRPRLALQRTTLRQLTTSDALANVAGGTSLPSIIRTGQSCTFCVMSLGAMCNEDERRAL